MNERAGSSPPTSSMTMSTSGSPSTRWASFVIGSRARSRPSRGRVRSVSATAARVSRQPARSSRVARWVSRSLTTPPPTVPRPRRASLTFFMGAAAGGRKIPPGSAVEAAEAPERLADTLLVLHEREPHVALAVLAEADAGRDRDLRFLDEELGELQRTHGAIGFGDG